MKDLSTSYLLFTTLNTFFKKKLFILGTFLFITFLIIFGVFLVGPSFVGQSIVLVNGKQSVLNIEQNDVQSSRLEIETTMVTMSEIASSRALAERVVDKTGYTEVFKDSKLDPDLRSKIKDTIKNVIISPIILAQALGLLVPEEVDYREGAITELQEDLLTAEWDIQTQLMSVAVSTPTPELSNKLSNTVVDEFILMNAELASSKYKTLKVGLESSYKKASADLAVKEKALSDFKIVNIIGDLEDSRFLKLSSLADLQASLLASRSSQKDQESELASIKGEIVKQDPNVVQNRNSSLDVENDPQLDALSAELEQLQTQLLVLQQSTGQEAQIAAVTASISQTQEAINKRTATLVVSSESTTSPNPVLQDLTRQMITLNASILGAKAQQKAIEGQILGLESEIGPMSKQELELTRLERDQQLAVDRYADLSKNLRDIDDRLNNSIPDLDIQVVQRSNLAKTADPNSPYWPRVLFIAFFVAGVVSLTLAFLIEYFNDSFAREEDLEQKFNIDVLGALDKVKGL